MHNLLPFTIIICYLLGCNLKMYAHWIWTSYKSQPCKPYIYKSDNTYYYYCHWRCNKTKSHFRCKLWSHPNLYSCLNQIFWFCFKCRLSLWFENFNEFQDWYEMPWNNIIQFYQNNVLNIFLMRNSFLLYISHSFLFAGIVYNDSQTWHDWRT